MSGWYLNYGMPEARVWECCSLEMQAEGKIALHQVPWPDARGGHFNFRPFEALTDTDLYLTVGIDPRPPEKAGGLPALKMELSYTFTNPYTLESRKVGVSIPVVPDSRARLWFACPHCGRRCGKLYLPAWGWEFRCRLCHSLNYRKALSRNPFVRVVELWEVAAMMIARGVDGQKWFAAELTRIFPELNAAMRGEKLSRREKRRLEEQRQGAEATGLLAGWYQAQVEAREFVFPNPFASPMYREAARLRRRLRRSMRLRCGPLGDGQALCLRCHTRRKMTDAEPFMMKSGRRAVRGKCASCEATVVRIIPRQQGLGSQQPAYAFAAAHGVGPDLRASLDSSLLDVDAGGRSGEWDQRP